MTREDRDAAFTEYVAARQAHLRRVAYAVVGDWALAEDVLQTALAKLYVAWPRLHRDGREDAYVRQIIVRCHLDERRRGWFRRERPGLDGHDGPGRNPMPTEERSALVDALQALPPMQRRVVVLRHWLGLSVEETAADLQISTGTVKSYSHRALQRLRTTLVEREA